MCRHAAYLGPAVAIDLLTHRFDHGLEHQSYAPRELLTGVVCADGFGVGWHETSVQPEPARYANPMPIWSDASFPSMAALVQSSSIMAAVRNASVAGTSIAANCAPFQDGKYLFSLNGFLDDFDAWMPFFEDHMDSARRTRVKGNTDAEWLFQMILAAKDTGASLLEAVQQTLRQVADHGRTLGQTAQLNVLVGDGDQVVASRYGNQPKSNSLYMLRDAADIPDGILVASEPLMDDPEWEPVADFTVVVLQAGAPPVRMAI